MRYFWYYFLLLKCAEEEENRASNLPYRRHHSRYQKRYHRALELWERWIRARKIPRQCLLDIGLCPWRKILDSSDDQAMITLTGFDHESFYYLLRSFAPIFDANSPFGDADGDITKISTKSWKRCITAADCLGVILTWTRTKGGIFSLQMHFGMTMSNLASYLSFGRCIVVKILQDDVMARIVLPSQDETQQYISAVN